MRKTVIVCDKCNKEILANEERVTLPPTHWSRRVDYHSLHWERLSAAELIDHAKITELTKIPAENPTEP